MWYWIALAVVWSSTAHYGLGVPFDLVQRARRLGGQSAQDLADMVRINCNRLLFIGSMSGLWIIGFVCFVLTALALLGFVYGVELAQAIFLIVFPLSIVGVLSISAARTIRHEGLEGEDMIARLIRHRFYVQLVGLVAIFITALWGMWQNMQIGALGG